MSTTSTMSALSLPLVTRRVRAYFAPVNRALKLPTVFDPALSSGFPLSAPPAPWVDLGWIDNFVRKSASQIASLTAGAPAATVYQVRQSTEASLSFSFKVWSKLTMALAAGSQHMNVLAAPGGGAAIGSGGKAIAACTLGAGSSASILVLSSVGTLSVGAIVSVDADFLGQPGFVGAGVSAAYVTSASAVGSDPDYIRRVSFNVSRVANVSGVTLQLSQPLPAGVPLSGMKVQQVMAFVDREGGSFFQEWSALFVMQGEQGDRLLLHYPRLQAMVSPQESVAALVSPMETVGLGASFRALPILDGNDGEQVLCYRTYVPGTNALV